MVGKSNMHIYKFVWNTVLLFIEECILFVYISSDSQWLSSDFTYPVATHIIAHYCTMDCYGLPSVNKMYIQ